MLSNLRSTDSAPKRKMNQQPPDRAGASCPPTTRQQPDYQSPARTSRNYSEGNSFPEISSLILAAGQHVGLTFCLATFCAIAFATVAVNFFPAQYQSVGYVQVRQRESYVLATQQTRSEDLIFVRAQEALVVQQQTLERALQDPELIEVLGSQPDAQTVNWLRSQIAAKIPNGTEVMGITASNPSRELSYRMATAVTNAYMADATSRMRSARDKRVNELERAAREADEKLSQRWKALEEMAGKLGTGNPQSLSVSEQIQLQGYRDSSTRLRNVQLQRNQLEIQLAEELRKESRATELSDADCLDTVRKEPEIVARREKLESIDAKLREMAQLVSSPDSPRLKRLKEDRDFYAKQLEELTQEFLPRVKKERSELSVATNSSEIQGIERQISILKEEEEVVRQAMNKLESTIEVADARNGVQLEILRHDIEREERLADNLWNTVKEIRIEDNAEPRIALIDMPKLADHADRSKQWKAAIVAVVVGMLFAILLVGYVEWKLCRIRRPEDVTVQTGIEVFGTGSFCSGLPLLWKMRNARQDPLISGVSEVAAQLLLQAAPNGSLPSVMVTSAISTDPRYVVALELAMALAYTGKRTLLVDCDGTSVDLGRRLGSQSLPGLAQLGPDTSPDQFIVHPVNVNFEYMPVGKIEKSATLVSAKLLPVLLNAVRSHYEAIVVHGSPVLNQAESVLLATQVDTTVFAIVQGKSRWNLLAAARHRLQFANAKILGAVFHIPGWKLSPKNQNGSGSYNSGSLEESLQQEVHQLQQEIDGAAVPMSPDPMSVKPTSRQPI